MKAHRSRDLRIPDDCLTWSNFRVIVFLLKQDGKRYVWVALILNFLGMTSASAVDWRFRNHYLYFHIAVSVRDIGTCFWFQFLYSERKFVFWRLTPVAVWHLSLFLFEATVKLNVYSRKYCSVAAKVQAELKSFCGKTYRLAFGLVQRWKKLFGKAKALEFEKKKGIAWHIDAISVAWLLSTTASRSDCEISSDCGKRAFYVQATFWGWNYPVLTLPFRYSGKFYPS